MKFGSGPIADFSYTGGGAAPCSIVFNNKSKDATSYNWDFGDGTHSNETNPIKIYDLGGTYTVTLKATNDGGNDEASKNVIIDNAKPVVEILVVNNSIALPNNCPASFQISNIGPQGSILDYEVADDGALQGYLNIKNGSGSLQSQSSAAIEVTVKEDFLSTGFGTIAGSTLVLRVYTPQATNLLVVPVSVNITSGLGIWSGTWSGKSYSSGVPGTGPEPTALVNGTWVLDLQAINTVDNSASGTLTWNGNDIYWVYDYNDGNLIATPKSFIPNRTIQFNSSNSTIVFPSGGPCEIIQLTIDGAKNAPNPSDALYGPWFNVNLNTKTNTAFMDSNNGFVTKPYDISNNITVYSNGNVTGSKQDSW